MPGQSTVHPVTPGNREFTSDGYRIGVTGRRSYVVIILVVVFVLCLITDFALAVLIASNIGNLSRNIFGLALCVSGSLLIGMRVWLEVSSAKDYCVISLSEIKYRETLLFSLRSATITFSEIHSVDVLVMEGLGFARPLQPSERETAGSWRGMLLQIALRSGEVHTFGRYLDPEGILEAAAMIETRTAIGNLFSRFLRPDTPPSHNNNRGNAASPAAAAGGVAGGRRADGESSVGQDFLSGMASLLTAVLVGAAAQAAQNSGPPPPEYSINNPSPAPPGAADYSDDEPDVETGAALPPSYSTLSPHQAQPR